MNNNEQRKVLMDVSSWFCLMLYSRSERWKKKVILMQSFGFVCISRLNCNMILVCVCFFLICVYIAWFFNHSSGFHSFACQKLKIHIHISINICWIFVLQLRHRKNSAPLEMLFYFLYLNVEIWPWDFVLLLYLEFKLRYLGT